MNAVQIDRQHASGTGDIPTTEALERWLMAVLGHHPDEQRNELTVRFVDEEESHHLNHTYRGKPSSTNVLSFPFDGPPGLALPLLGDLVICVPVIQREAQEQAKNLCDHYAHMVVHGTLHLMGYDHVGDDEANAMEALECVILAELGIASPYQAPTTESAPDTEDKRNNS
ncbi:rRNA maturation RNase YbeY [Halomonas halocynthiae]|uniref:rRNA maturation RNase YbeY n=1 Tax=Halomonas halocynthiae TaxID=176290 RepID=UPI0004115B8D|nr:rRNA maturation RNase YbeY [Halomonas halocynthiae]